MKSKRRLVRVGFPGGEYATLREGLESVRYDERAHILLAPGVYREKIFSEKKDLVVEGAGRDKSILLWDDGAYQKEEHPSGQTKGKLGTFRSFSCFFGGEKIHLKNLSVKNEAGAGHVAGQAIALYLDAREAILENVRLSSRQDTVFLSPLPDAEREPGGFYGPRSFNARRPCQAYFRYCIVEGDVDFIFGGGDALFYRCKIRSLNREGEEVKGYVAAPSTKKGGMGLVFYRCDFEGEDTLPVDSVYLARPWRKDGKAKFVDCRFGAHIRKELFCGWNRAAYNKNNFRCLKTQSSPKGILGYFPFSSQYRQR